MRRAGWPQRRTESDAAALRAAASAREATAGPAELAESNLELHRPVVRAARNPLLVRLYDSFVDALHEAASQVVTGHHLHGGVERETTADAHHALVEAAAAGDAEAAVTATGPTRTAPSTDCARPEPGPSSLQGLGTQGSAGPRHRPGRPPGHGRRPGPRRVAARRWQRVTYTAGGPGGTRC
ncbi:FCD domain-containing protein [Kitasatospora sp. NPDC017646]|uniref:FCD domain-containing protein n=1 Tax=Kitasatospora sp. NPDC017646 TaxID=3364024 RepID=UPI0037AD6663